MVWLHMWKTEQEMIWNAKNCTACKKIKLSHCYMLYVHAFKRVVVGVWHVAVCLAEENTKWLYFTSKGWLLLRPKFGSLKLYFLLGAHVLAQHGCAASLWLLQPTRWHSRLVSSVRCYWGETTPSMDWFTGKWEIRLGENGGAAWRVLWSTICDLLVWVWRCERLGRYQSSLCFLSESWSLQYWAS